MAGTVDEHGRAIDKLIKRRDKRADLQAKAAKRDIERALKDRQRF
jgi:hypothetical protein